VKPEDIVVTRWGARFLNLRFACSVGRGGIVPPGTKREGDGATPSGTHRIVGMLYRPDRMTRPADWALPIRPSDLWSDDPKDEDYNLMVRAPHRFSHERLRRADPMYDLILITDWNWPYSVPGRGSAIFVHAWRRPHARTAGCVALAPDDLRWIAPRILHQTRLIICG
jgi:L,D-peptidoglycan transpeptidase YkuD (ErfK/YbiS/YcfS/YnhG family)